jgi:hypothetical protein
MKMNSADWIGGLKDNFEILKVALPALLSILILGAVAGLAIDLALSHPLVFVAWSITCFVGGIVAHRWWSNPEPQTSGEWS